jgi:hypothetical protein
MAEIGRDEGACAVKRIVTEKIVQGPGLNSALKTAAQLRVRLPADVIAPLLRTTAHSALLGLRDRIFREDLLDPLECLPPRMTRASISAQHFEARPAARRHGFDKSFA